MSTVLPRRRRAKLAPYLLISAAIAILLLGMGYPLVWQIVTSFQEFGLAQQFGKPAAFVGFDNYAALAADPQFWLVTARSLAFCIIGAGVTVVVGTAFAVLMTRIPKGVRLTLQISLLLAWAMPIVAAMTVWIWLFDRRRGVVNYVLGALGIDMNRYDWLSNPWTFFLVAGIIVVWMSVPFVAFSVYAGLTQVSDEVIEAAQLDGANGWQRFRLITAPLIRPVLSIVLLLNLIWDLRVFTHFTMLQDAGGKTSDFDVLGTYIYKIGAGAGDFGASAAVSIFILAITIALSWFYVRSMLKEERS